MEILVVGDHLTSGEVWENIIALSYPTATVSWEKEASLHSLDIMNLQKMNIVICLYKNPSQQFYSLLKQCFSVQVPVLCVVEEDIEHMHYKQLFQYGVKGFIGPDMSVETFKKVVHIVKDGGIYIELQNQKRAMQWERSAIMPVKPKLKEIEWQVFSLISKGNTKDEISQLLQIPVEIVSNYQKEILQKTSSKTLPGAVAEGLNQGWLPNW